MSLEFDKYELNEFCTFSYGKMPKKDKIIDDITKYPIFSGYQIVGYYEEYNIDKDELIVIARGVGGTGDVKLTPAKCYLTNLSIGFSINQKYALTKFLYYYFQINHLGYLNSGSAQPQITINDLKHVEVPLPQLTIQSKIIYIIDMIDKKIENCKALNKNLQTLSKLLLKYHLEDFKPYLVNGIKNSEIGDIPKDWIVYDFDSISNIYNGYSYKGNELQPSNSAMVTIKNFNRDGSFRADGFKEIIYSDKVKEYHFLNENDVLISCTDVTQDADIIGNCVLLLDKMGYDDLIMSMDLVKIESKKKEINNFLLASILKSYRFKMHILGYVNGTTVLHLDKKGIKKFKLALPEDLTVLKDLNDILENNYKQIAINQKEINNLQKLRDTLLPKLMSGEIDVSKINCDL